MAIRTREEYIESIRKQKPNVYMAGAKVDNLVENPWFAMAMNSSAVTFQVANDPRYRDLATLTSPLTGEKISQWTHILGSMEDSIAATKLFRDMGDYLVICPYRCITSDSLNALWAVTYDMDKKYGTGYHRRLVNIVKEAQRNDWIIGGTIVDPKGDRNLRPAQQPDPDVYLHIVDRRSDGIVVRGAKAHSTAAPYTNMLCAVPCLPLHEDEKDYAVAFFTPVDTKGVTFMCRQSALPSGPKELENPLSSKFGGHVEAFTIYEDVFVPWERVVMAGEWEFAGPLMNIFSAFHMVHKCGCRAASTDLYIGATALIAEYNGLAQTPHIRDYLTEMVMSAEITYSCGLSAAVQGTKHDSGVFIPKALPAFTGKAFASKKLGEDRYYMQDAAGGLVQTMARETEYQNPVTRKYMDKFLKAAPGVPAEQRIRAFKLIEDLTASEFAGWYHAMAISGGGGPQLLRTGLMFDYDLERSKQRAKIAAGIK